MHVVVKDLAIRRAGHSSDFHSKEARGGRDGDYIRHAISCLQDWRGHSQEQEANSLVSPHDPAPMRSIH